MDVQEQMYQFGLNVGLAFQIKDDLLDYGFGEKIGKPVGIDLQERKLTLPLIHTLENADSKTKRMLINIVKRHNTNTKKVKELVEVVIQTGGIDYARKKMEEFRDKALEILGTFPSGSAKESLQQLVQYTIDRKK